MIISQTLRTATSLSLTLCLSVASKMICTRWKCRSVTWLQILFCLFFPTIFSRKSKRRAHSDDYYIRQLIENDRQMLRNQQRQLQLDEQVSAAAVQLFSAVTEYLNKMNSAMQPPAEPTMSSPTGIRNPVAASSRSMPSSDTEPSNVVRTTQACNSDSPQTTRSVKRLCTGTFLGPWSAMVLQTKLLWYLKKRR